MGSRSLYKPKNDIRFVTASSLFDGHDASINIMRRILQACGAEVIHLGIIVRWKKWSMPQFRRMSKELRFLPIKAAMLNTSNTWLIYYRKEDAAHIRIFGGGGGVIIPREIKELHEYGVARIFSPEDGRRMGFKG